MFLGGNCTGQIALLRLNQAGQQHWIGILWRQTGCLPVFGDGLVGIALPVGCVAQTEMWRSRSRIERSCRPVGRYGLLILASADVGVTQSQLRLVGVCRLGREEGLVQRNSLLVGLRRRGLVAQRAVGRCQQLVGQGILVVVTQRVLQGRQRVFIAAGLLVKAAQQAVGQRAVGLQPHSSFRLSNGPF